MFELTDAIVARVGHIGSAGPIGFDITFAAIGK
jgi:hypothetical protein